MIHRAIDIYEKILKDTKYSYQSKLDFELDCNKLTHTLKYDPLDVTTLQLLQELEPKFSLQKELTKWQKIHKLKSQVLDIIIKNRENIVRLLYDEESMIVSVIKD
jgi:CTP-dependent riboflavin kinase